MAEHRSEKPTTDLDALRQRITAIEAGEPKPKPPSSSERWASQRSGLKRGATLQRKTALRAKTGLRRRQQPK
jgi:hypothetical protein